MTDTMLSETVDRLFGSLCDGPALAKAEEAGWAPEMWSATAELGLPWIGLPERAGGQGGTLSDASEVLRAAGAHALPLPLAETGLLAGWLLAGAGVQVPQTPLTVVPGRAEDTLRLEHGRLYGTAHRVPWARSAGQVVALLQTDGDLRVAAVPGDSAQVTKVVDLAGEPRDTVSFDGAVPSVLAPAAVDREALLYRGALARAVLMAGALQRVCELTVRYTREREQFGRPVARFQAVQQLVVTVVQETAAVGLAAATAVRRTELGGGRFEIAAAKLLANQAVHTAVRAAHQAHGAMGVTQEYPLHHATRRLRAWRCEYGDERTWSTRLGDAVTSLGADQLYPLITAGSALPV
ncbi:acyl-CoA dehydrogenase family protein [Streptomyces sp. NPDC048254]|uniref:acyl-CoA dehydrogenase family protein n=1 Tax=Streptomyces sp. NPDC048254 TaxID=3365525 RepID=UPI00371A9126